MSKGISKQIRDSGLFSTAIWFQYCVIQVAKKLRCKDWLIMHWTTSAVHIDHVLLLMMVGKSWGKSKLEQIFWPVEQTLHGPLQQAKSGGIPGTF